MKTKRITLLALLSVAAAAGLRAANATPVSRIEVIFSHPENFTDAANEQRGSDFGRDGNLAELKTYLERQATALVPEGQKLTVTVTDVDLAGEIEPWRSGQGHDVRIVKDIYSPKIDLSFKLTDASGAVVKEGERKLRNPTFLMDIQPNRDEPLVYEKALLKNWVRDEFSPAKATK